MNLPVLLAAAVLAQAPVSGTESPPLPADLAVRAEHREGATRCAACHTTSDWSDVAFAHERTAFALTGRHAQAACLSCHPGGQFARPTPTACAACHQDVHRGRMGSRCEGCHEPTAWSETAFAAQAHARTAFPLTGRHALLPCEECHGDRRDRSFARPAVRCAGCHEADFALRSAAAGVDHVAAGFATDCRSCHGTWRFSDARFPAHATCFQIDGGPHAGISCRGCHTASLPPIPPGGALTCAGDTADCLRCHAMPGIEARHSGVAGFQPYDRRCYECHGFH